MQFADLLTAPWWWLVAGAILLTLEVAAPGVFLLWLGVAAMLVAGLLFLTPLDLTTQFMLFGALSVAMVLFARIFLRYGVAISDLTALSRRGHHYIGQTVVVTEAIANGRGKVQVGDTLWNAGGPDAGIGARVRVTAVEGTLLKVELA